MNTKMFLKKFNGVGKVDKRVCSVCGCTTLYGCPGGCYWVADNLCSKCSRVELDSEKLISFVESCLEGTDNNKVFASIARWDKENTYWNLFMLMIDNDKVLCGGHYPLLITDMNDFVDVLNYLSHKKIKLLVNTKGYYSECINDYI